MRRIGRLRSEASPSKRAVIAWPPTTPIISREPVPALPKSSVSRGPSSEPSPAPKTLQFPSPRRVTVAPSWRQAPAVRNTSSPSSRPSIVVSPTQSRPRISDRCETDLSPGGRRRPERRLERSARSGVAAGCGFGPRLPNRVAFFWRSYLAPKNQAAWARKRRVSVLRENARERTQIEGLCAKMRAIVKNRQAPGKAARRSWALSRRADRPS